MKIGLIGPLPPLRGGISQYNHSLRGALTGAGHEVVAVSYRRLYPDFLFPGSSQFEERSTPPEPSEYPLLLAWDIATWTRAVALLRREKVQRLVIQHWHPFFVPCLRFLIRWSGAEETVVIAHNVLPHESSGLGKRLNPGLFRIAGRVLVGSSSQQKELAAITPNVPSHVVPHPVYDRFFPEPGDALQRHLAARRDLGVPDDEPYFVHLGLVREYKGLDVALRALASLHWTWLLDVAGEFYDDIGHYESLIAKLDLSEQVTLKNRYLQDDELARSILAADAVLLPYRHATQSGIAMAALAGGAPLIATRTGALADIVEPGVTGELAEPGHAKSYAQAIQRFLETGLETWRSRREAIAETARNRYSWMSVVDAIVGEGA